MYPGKWKCMYIHIFMFLVLVFLNSSFWKETTSANESFKLYVLDVRIKSRQKKKEIPGSVLMVAVMTNRMPKSKKERIKKENTKNKVFFYFLTSHILLLTSLFYPVSCLVTLVSCLMTLVSCFLSLVPYLSYLLSCLLSFVSCLLSLVSCSLSLVSYLLSLVFLHFCEWD